MLVLVPLLLKLIEPTLPPPAPLLREKGGREASFIPAPLLESGRRAESANADPAAEAIFTAMIGDAYKQMKNDPVSAAHECAVPVIGEVGPKSPDDRTDEGSETERTLKNNQIAVLVRVVGVVPGWYLLYGHAASLVYARVVEVFHDNAGLLEPGQTITFLRESASFSIGQRRFCTRDPQTVPPPIGSLVVVAGQHDPANQGHLFVSRYTVFTVRDGQILPPPALLTDRAPIPMERLRPTAGRKR